MDFSAELLYESLFQFVIKKMIILRQKLVEEPSAASQTAIFWIADF